jgi:hypothetical protein
VSLLKSIDRDHVLTAIETWDAAGGANYLLVRGGSSTHVLLHGGREYDASAIAGIAHGLATGRTLTPDEVPGGGAGAAKALTRLGFTIRDDSPVSTAPTRTRRATGPTTSATGKRKPPRVAATDKPVELCPTCFLALPATGVCDNCS